MYRIANLGLCKIFKNLISDVWNKLQAKKPNISIVSYTTKLSVSF